MNDYGKDMTDYDINTSDFQNGLRRSYEQQMKRVNDPDVPECKYCGYSGMMDQNEDGEWYCINATCIADRIRTVQEEYIRERMKEY